MNYLKNSQSTQSTIANSQVDLNFNTYIKTSNFSSSKDLILNEKSKRSSITNDENQRKNQITIRKSINGKAAKHNKLYINNFSHQTKGQKCFNALNKIFLKKKRYTMQVLKQFILFPDESMSSLTSLSMYDPLIFHDQVIHTMVKIIETKTIENKIWGFINLMMVPKLKAAVKITEKTDELFKKRTTIQKKMSFQFIRTASQSVRETHNHHSYQNHYSHQIYQNNITTTINHQNANMNMNKGKENPKPIAQENQTNKLKKSTSAAVLTSTSKLISQQVRPLITTTTTNTTIKNQDQSQLLQRSRSIYTLPVIRIKADQIQYHQPTATRISDSRYYQKYTEKKSEPVIIQKKQPSQEKVMKKYNVIHYHQRPKHTNTFYVASSGQCGCYQSIFHSGCNCNKSVLCCGCNNSYQTLNCSSHHHTVCLCENCCDHNQNQSHTYQINVNSCQQSRHSHCPSSKRNLCPQTNISCHRSFCGQSSHCIISQRQRECPCSSTSFSQRSIEQCRKNLNMTKVSSSKDISDLDSKIQYLNFLRKIAAENGSS